MYVIPQYMRHSSLQINMVVVLFVEYGERKRTMEKLKIMY